MIVVLTNTPGRGQIASEEVVEIVHNRTLRTEDDLNIVLFEQIYGHLSHAAAYDYIGIMLGDERRNDAGGVGRRGDVFRISDLGTLAVQYGKLPTMPEMGFDRITVIGWYSYAHGFFSVKVCICTV